MIPTRTPSPWRRSATLALAAALASLVGPAVAATGPMSAGPAPGLTALAAAHPGSAPKKKKAPAAPVKLVDINSAGRAELKTLPGIGDAEADRIVAARPFLTKAELVTKKVIPTGPYLSLKNRVIAMQKIKPKAAAKPKP